MINKQLKSMYKHHYFPLVLCLLHLIWAHPLQAAVCVAKHIPEADFVWQKGVQSLPANAKGALFKIAPLKPIYTFGAEADTGAGAFLATLYRDMPLPLLSSHFTVYDQHTKRQLTPTIVNLQYKEHFFKKEDGVDYFRYLQVDDKVFSCVVKRAGDIYKYCNDVPGSFDFRNVTYQLFKDTQSVKKGTGLFRIGVEEGFEAGHTYTIQFLGMPGYWNLEKTKQSYRAPKSLTITIDKEIFDLNSFEILRFVEKQNPKNKKEKRVFYNYNAMQSRYQDAFYSLITIENDDGQNNIDYLHALKYLPKPQPDCYLTPYLWHKYFNQTGIFALSNIYSRGKSVIEAQGRIGFFEVEDAVFETVETEFKVK